MMPPFRDYITDKGAHILAVKESLSCSIASKFLFIKKKHSVLYVSYSSLASIKYTPLVVRESKLVQPSLFVDFSLFKYMVLLFCFSFIFFLLEIVGVVFAHSKQFLSRKVLAKSVSKLSQI